MFEHFELIVRTWGYGGLFVSLMASVICVSLPIEVMLIFVGTLIAKGDMRLGIALVVAALGALAGAAVNYIIGRTVGLKLIHKWGRRMHITPERERRFDEWYRRRGRWGLVVAYFIPILRHFIPLAAGIADLPVVPFLAWAGLGGFIWPAAYILGGYGFGERWKDISVHSHKVILWSLAAIGAAVTAGYALRWLRRRSPARGADKHLSAAGSGGAPRAESEDVA